ncbi:MAG TPA: aspartate kinase [Bacteroidales bacterium]|nr:aspartate kinase [Bacteroidales bacterium]HPF04118.1 aspartate kinase [Bacteroidales bacterium]HPJ60074.1 aspartate kinase [Bacteroidales bacterium]HPR13298.1 aspartate kinase [Bacteroidales bacterium]HRW85545.1 aspartate kinase [Bacteroidales bacterium]
MKVYKFGGASVKDAAGIRNLAEIVSEEKDDLVVVVSAFGKTTNALEQVLKKWLEGDRSYKEHLDNIYSYHASVADDLFTSGNSAREKIDNSFAELREYLISAKRSHYDYEYDQVVSFGELWSTVIVAGYLVESGLNSEWVDIRKSLITDDRYRDANILWNETQLRIKTVFDFSRSQLFVTQGFIGGTAAGKPTTLGREGSDYTAALLANMLDAESVTVWKDVPGLLNADPKWLPDAGRLDEISYKEAVEMTFSGAKVIHPKTIKPLHNKNIPLFVKCFMDPSSEGTVVRSDATLKKIMPVFVRKENQILLSILPRDFSFVMGDNLSMVFQQFVNNGIKVNLVEASAISLDVCVDDERSKVEDLLEDLDAEYSALYNENVELLSIRHYTPEAISRIISGREILLEQKTRSTVRFVVRKG